MKKTVLSLVILAIVSAIWVSCTKDAANGNNNGNNNTNTGGSLSATISSKIISSFNFSAKTVTAVKVSDSGKYLIEVLAYDNSNNEFELYFVANGTGTYPIAVNHYSEFAFYDGASPSAECTGFSGSLTVTSFSSSNVQGTFNFTGPNLSATTADTLKVTAGAFNVNYQ